MQNNYKKAEEVWFVWQGCQEEGCLFSKKSIAVWWGKCGAVGHNAQHHFWPNISAQTHHANGQAQWWRGDDLGLFCSHRILDSCGLWVSHELWTPTFSHMRIIIQQLKLGQYSKCHPKPSNNRMADKEKNQGIVMGQSMPKQIIESCFVL